VGEAQSAIATFSFIDGAISVEGETLELVDADGTSVVFEIDDEGDGSSQPLNVPVDRVDVEDGVGSPSTNTMGAISLATSLAWAVNEQALLNIDALVVAEGVVQFTQGQVGAAGNTSIVVSNPQAWQSVTSVPVPEAFDGGTDGLGICEPALGSEDNPAQSCKEILDAGASTGDGVYWVVTDAQIAQPTLCDMTTDGGGWTIVFMPGGENLNTLSPTFSVNGNSYNNHVSGSWETLLVHRNAATLAIDTSSRVRFFTPQSWKNGLHPMAHPASTNHTQVYCADLPPEQLKLRFGYQNWQGQYCEDWFPAPGPFGRICVSGCSSGASLYGTASPAMDCIGLADCEPDQWNSNEKGFSIAVR
jgi:hypothetical protein